MKRAWERSSREFPRTQETPVTRDPREGGQAPGTQAGARVRGEPPGEERLWASGAPQACEQGAVLLQDVEQEKAVVRVTAPAQPQLAKPPPQQLS